jgi:hypothetical protein
VNLPTLTYWHDGLGSDVTEKGSNFNGRALGARTNLFLKGASIKTWKSGAGNVTGATFSYKIWKTGDSEPAYSTRSVGWTSDDGGGNQTWANFGAEINVMSGLTAGSYNLKVLFTVAGTGVPGILSSGPFTATFDIAPVQAPGNLRASATNETDFTAAWDAVSGATGYRLDVGANATFSGAGGTASDLFISEYIEGSSNNKAIEIFNGTGASVNLGTAGYTLRVYANGNTTPSTITLSGTVADNDVFVVANSSANAAILAQADQTSGSLTHNGNDVIALAKNSVNLDVVGTIGSAANFGLDVTKVRKSSVAAGTTTYDTGEWDDYAVDTTSYLGSHTFSGGSGAPAYVPGYSNRAVSGTSQIVTGLTQNTVYYFRARTESAFGTSTNSATASVTTRTAAPQNQTIDFPAIGAQWTTNILTLSATASSGLPVSFAVGSGPATISNGTTLAFSGAGTVSIVASQAGNGSWNPAPNVTNSFSVTKATAGVTLNGLAQTYDGTPRVVTATTTPSGLSVGVTYNGSGTAPTSAGSYAATGTVSDAMYQGSAAGTLVVAKATAGVALGGLSHFHDGSPKSATVTTDPLGLSVAVTYDGSGSAPSAIGSYAVTALVAEVNYAGSAVGTLVISQMTVSNLFEQWLQDDQGRNPEDPDFAWDADVDEDGATTYEEFLADTDPAASNSVLKLSGTYFNAAQASNTTGQIRFSFPASSARYYQLIYTGDLSETLTNNLGWGIPGMVVTSDAPAAWYGTIRPLLSEPNP